MGPNATGIVRRALEGSGVELVGSCAIAAYDACAPKAFRSSALLPGARGLVVAGSAGPTLWRHLRARHFRTPHPGEQARARAATGDEPHPLDRFVAALLDHADAALAGAHVRFRRFEAALHAAPAVDFVALARLVGLGSAGPFGMLIHDEHGAWWALRGAWLVAAVVDEPLPHRPPCVGCPAPCIGGWANAGGIARATPEVRGRCVVGQASRYDDDQIAYHYDRPARIV